MRKLGDLCRFDPALSPIFKQLEKQEQLFGELLAQLPPRLRQGCLTSLLKSDRTLLIFVSSPVWLAQLRFYTVPLRRRFGLRWGVREVRWQVVPPEAKREISPPPIEPPSPEVLAEMEEEARQCEDEELRAAMERLIKTVRGDDRKR